MIEKAVHYHEFTTSESRSPIFDHLPKGADVIGATVVGGSTGTSTLILHIQNAASMHTVDAAAGAVQSWWVGSAVADRAIISNGAPPQWLQGIPLIWRKDNDGSEQIMNITATIGSGTGGLIRIYYTLPYEGVAA